MILDRLEIERERWGPNKGQLKGRVRFMFMDGTENAIDLNLTPELSEQFMAVVGEAIITAAKGLQAKLVANLIDYRSDALPLLATTDPASPR